MISNRRFMLDRIPHRWNPCGLLLLLSAVLVLAGCVSTQDRYEKAQELTAEGRYAEAARYYVRVLRDEPDWPNARQELQAVGQRAVDRAWGEAEAAADAGRYETAVGVLDDLDALRADVETVGVMLDVPEDYAAFRQEMVDAAADLLVAEGRQAEEDGDWEDADAAYEWARRYVRSERRLARLDEAQARVALHWSKEEMMRHRFRAAHERAEHVFAFVEDDHALALEAETVQAEAVERGTRAVAFLPLGRTERAADEAPEPFLDDLNDVLLYDFWAEPPLFMIPVDLIATRRTVRRMNAHRAVLTTADAANVGRLLDADFVVVGELVSFVRAEKRLERERHPTRIRMRSSTGSRSAWRDTSYVVETFDLVLQAAVDYRIVDSHSRRVIEHGGTREEREVGFRRGVFPGDYRRLDLSGSELSLFDPDDRRTIERDLESELLDRLAADLADRVFGGILRHIE